MKEIERIARELCIADGHDPNLWAMSRADKPGAFGTVALMGSPAQQWSLYEHLVSEGIRSLIRGFESQGTETSLERYALAVLKGAELGPEPTDPQYPRARYATLPRP